VEGEDQQKFMDGGVNAESAGFRKKARLHEEEGLPVLPGRDYQDRL
jgi:hypothetical protein